MFREVDLWDALTRESVKDVFLKSIRPNCREREKFEEAVRATIAERVEGKREILAEFLEKDYLLEDIDELVYCEPESWKEYVDDILSGKERLTYGFIRDIEHATGEHRVDLLPLREGLPSSDYHRIWKALTR